MGYLIKKDQVDEKTLTQIKKDLTVSPIVLQAYKEFAKPVEFTIFQESPNYLYIPRYYGIETFGSPRKNYLQSGSPMNLQCPYDLLPHQVTGYQKTIKTLTDKGGGVLQLPCGFGKCLSRGSKVLMYNGEIKNVEDINIGDQLMGDDSTPRNVLSLARGKDEMYEIQPIKGEPWGCNKSHILSLKCSTNWSHSMTKGSIHDIELNRFLNLPKSFHGRGTPLRLYKVPIIFPPKEVDLDPYMLGYWLGDGMSSKPGITSINPEVLDYFRKYIDTYGLILKQTKTDKISYTIVQNTCDSLKHQWSSDYGSNYFLYCLKNYDLINNKHIPLDYKCNSRDVQLKVLAGLIDSDGHLDGNCYEVVQKNEKLADDIIYLCRSLGFAAYKQKVQKTCTNSTSEWAIREHPEDKFGQVTGTYYRCDIFGNGLEQIPVLLNYKKASPRKQIKDPLVTGFSVKSVGVGDYYGFEIDGNHRYLLGDFTVTHNTFVSIKAAIHLGVKTLVVVNKEPLMDQWIEAIEKFTGGQAKIGIIQQDKVEVEQKDFVIAMLHSLCKKPYPKKTFDEFGCCICDECFPADTHIVTDQGNKSILSLFNMWQRGQKTPMIKSFNETTKKFEYSELTHAWVKNASHLINITFNNTTIQCTPNHKFLTLNGYKEAITLTPNDLLVTHLANDNLFKTIRVSGIQMITIDTSVYDIEVAHNHNFIVVGPNDQNSSGPVVHNCHHIGSEMFSQALPKMASKYMLGLSATPKRKDGLSHVFYKYIGELFHSERRTGSNRVLVKRFKLTSNSPMYETLYMKNGIKNTVSMITNLAKFDVRTALIVETIRILMTQDRKILLLSGRRDHLEQIYDLLEKSDIKTIHGRKITFGYYYGNQGGNKKQHKLMLAESAKCDVVLGTHSIACISDQTMYVNHLTGEEMTLETIAKINNDQCKPLLVYDTNIQKYRLLKPMINLPVISLNEETTKFELDYAINIGYTEPKQCYKLTHVLGEIVASYDHKFYTQKGWITMDQLTNADYLVCDRKLNVDSIDIPELTIDDCWLIGCLMGDGAISQYKKGVLMFINMDDDITNEMSRILSVHGMKLLPKKYKYWIRRTVNDTKTKNLPTWLRMVIEKYNLGHKGIDKSFPKELMMLPEDKIAGFLGGLYDTDGSAPNKRSKDVVSGGQSICYNTSSYKMKNQINFLLKRLGIQSTITQSMMITNNLIYRVNILASELDRFYKYVDIRLTRKKNIIRAYLDETKQKTSIFNSVPYIYIGELREKLKKISAYEIHKAKNLLKNEKLPFSSFNTYTAMTYKSYKFLCDHYGFVDQFENKCLIKIKSIEKLDNSDQIKLCDMTVHKNHNFMIGGILAHNSEGLDLPGLNTEILATPVSDVEQSIGRILRKFHEHINPIVVDFVDACGNFSKQAALRAKFYKDEDYEIQDLKVPLGNNVCDLQPFLPEIHDYLFDTNFQHVQSKLDNDEQPEKSSNIKFGKCLLDDDTPPTKPAIKSDSKITTKNTTKLTLKHTTGNTPICKSVEKNNKSVPTSVNTKSPLTPQSFGGCLL